MVFGRAGRGLREVGKYGFGGGRGPVTLLVRLHVNVRQRQVYSLGDEKGL